MEINILAKCIFQHYNDFGKIIGKDNIYFIGEFKNGYRYKGISFYPKDKGLLEANWEYN